MKTILDFQKKKKAQQKISMVTCYDTTMARLVANSQIDAILIGDSLAQVIHGHATTLNADTSLMALHTAAVSRVSGAQFIVADMPFMSTRKGIKYSIEQVEKLMKAGAQAVKIEGADGHLRLIQHIVESGVPVMGHLGLTPQSIHQLGGPKVQGKQNSQAEKLLQDSIALEKAGAFAIVLECVPWSLAKKITETLSIPTIGIGAGVHTDGQILVLHDLLGLNQNFNPKFLKKYLQGAEMVSSALNEFAREVEQQQFPTAEQSYE